MSVENPLSVKRFIQMKLTKNKTDKSDSKLIGEYAKQVELKLWKGNSRHQSECLQITRLLSVYIRQHLCLRYLQLVLSVLQAAVSCVVILV